MDDLKQSSLHLTPQTTLQASGAKSFAMKPTLSEQVRAYIASRGEGYTPARLAADVAKLQSDLPEEKRCKRQNIEQLLESDFRTVRYVIQLAAAMGTSAEALSAGAFQPGLVKVPELSEQASNDEVIRVPLLANAGSMGSGIEVLHDDVMVGSIALSPDWIAKRIRPSTTDALRFFHAYGDSMSPTFEDGDILLVDTGAINPSGADGVYVLEAHHRLFIKRVTERLGGGYAVTSDNPGVKTVDDLNGGNEVNVKGRVVWVWNGKKL